MDDYDDRWERREDMRHALQEDRYYNNGGLTEDMAEFFFFLFLGILFFGALIYAGAGVLDDTFGWGVQAWIVEHLQSLKNVGK